MGLLRIAIVIAAGVAVLPSDRESQDKLYAHAANATTWAVTFCDRNAKTCEQGAELWTKFAAKAQFGAKMALDLARESSNEQIASDSGRDYRNGDDSRQAPLPAQSAERASPAVFERRGGTLTAEDLKPAWRGKTVNKGSF